MLHAAAARARALPVSLRAWILLGVAAASSAALLFVEPIPQDPAYHAFADRRPFLGIPNFGDVITNLPFVAVGLLGIALLRRAPFRHPDERLLWAATFGALALTGLGSFYYHWAPDNGRLVWDRLPLTLLFASCLAAVVAERIDARAGVRLALPLLALGAASVLYWGWTESRGAGDLRPYALAQYLTIVLVLLVAFLFPPRYTRSADLLRAAAAYGAAKVGEVFDAPILALTGGLASGHTLKHLFAALAMALLLAMLLRRAPEPAAGASRLSGRESPSPAGRPASPPATAPSPGGSSRPGTP